MKPGQKDKVLYPDQEWLFAGLTVKLAEGERPVNLTVVSHNGEEPWWEWGTPEIAKIVTRKTPTSLTGENGQR